MNSETAFDFQWATPDDEPDIRALVGSVPVPGAVTVRFAREPDYFLGTTIMGDPCDVMVIRHRLDGRLAGIACRAERQVYLNGRESPLGYIGQIRVVPSFQGRWLVHRGAKWLKEASPAGLFYVAVIARENPRARRLFMETRMPGGLYAARVCGLTTCAILLRPLQKLHVSRIEVQSGSAEMLREIVEFLRLQGPHRQFFPAYTLEDFVGGARLRGLKPQDIVVARREGAVVGVMAAWDQAAYKQDIVDAYGPVLGRMRPFYNLVARLLGAQPLTPPGQAMPLAFASCICVADDDPAVMRVLLSACAQSAFKRGKAFLMLGLADDDPLLAVARRHLHITYRSDLFVASWSDDPAGLLDGRIPYVEIATL
jgi:hypothetical protein